MSIPLTHVQKKIWDDLVSLGARLGEKVPADCSGEEFDRSTRLWLLKFAQIAAAAPFTSVPIDDHSWSSMGFKGLTLAKIEEDELNPDAIPSDMHGIAVLIEKKDLSVLVPIASDLDEDAAEIFGKLVEAKVADFVDFAGFLDFAEGTDAFTPEEEVRAFDLSVDPRSAPQESGEVPPLAGGPLLETEITSSVITGSWKEIVDISKSASYPLGMAMLLRQPAAWDITRALSSGLEASDFPEFSEKLFTAAFFRSVRHDASAINSNRQMLEALLKKKPTIASQEGQIWFSEVYDLIQSFGRPAAQNGLCVALAVARQSRAYDFEAPSDFEMDENLLVWSTDGIEMVALGVNLDPVQAVVLSELARQKPEAFLDLAETDKQRWVPLEPIVIPNALISRYGVSSRGRNAEAYEKIRSATHSS